MRGFIEKDLRLLRGQKRTFLIIVALAVFLGYNSTDFFVVSYLTFVSGFLVFSTFNYDEHGNSISFLLSLPVLRQDYVRSKYVMGLLVTGAGWLIGMILTVVMSVIRGTALVPADLALQIVWLAVWNMILALILPAMIRFGAENGRIIMLALILGIAAVAFLVSKIAETMGMDLSFVIPKISMMGTTVLVLGIVAVTLVVMFLSYMISVQIMKKKEY